MISHSRRRFLIQSIAAAGVAATGRLFWLESEEFVPALFTQDDDWQFLSANDRLILAMVTPVILLGVSDKPISGQVLLNYLKDFDNSLTLLTVSQQKEFKELLQLLESMIGRVVVAGIWSAWNDASAETINKMLNNWRSSFLDLIKVAYAGLKELSFATWYGNPNSWTDIGYPGPPELGR